jgi:hypothetical protein
MAATGIIPVLSISPIAEDHCSLQHILGHLQTGLDPSRVFAVRPYLTLPAALAALMDHQFEVVVCERNLQPGSWKDVLEQAIILPDPTASYRHIPTCRRAPVGGSPEPGCLRCGHFKTA